MVQGQAGLLLQSGRQGLQRRHAGRSATAARPGRRCAEAATAFFATEAAGAVPVGTGAAAASAGIPAARAGSSAVFASCAASGRAAINLSADLTTEATIYCVIGASACVQVAVVECLNHAIHDAGRAPIQLQHGLGAVSGSLVHAQEGLVLPQFQQGLSAGRQR